MVSFYVLPDDAGTPIQVRELSTAFAAAGVSIAGSLTTAPVAGLTSRKTVGVRLTVSRDMSALELGSAARDTFEVDFRTDVSALLGIDVTRVSVLAVTGSTASVSVTFAVLPDDEELLTPKATLTAAFGASGAAVAGAFTTCLLYTSPSPRDRG